MSRITLTSYDEETGREVTMRLDEDQTWHDASEDFFAFLQGCGYVLDRKDFAEYWSQYKEDSVTITIRP